MRAGESPRQLRGDFEEIDEVSSCRGNSFQSMYNLHSHSLLSDGCLLPSELAVRYAAKGYKALAITDHADYSNIEMVCRQITRFCKKWPKRFPLKLLPGIELTHLPLEQIKPLVRFCRKNGIMVVIGHGETLAEPVLKGTNLAYLEAGVDILAHPGRLSDAEAKLAGKKGIFLEITSRKSHGITNSFVVKKAIQWNAPLIVNHDSHDPDDIITIDQTRSVAFSAGMSIRELEQAYSRARQFIFSL